MHNFGIFVRFLTLFYIFGATGPRWRANNENDEKYRRNQNNEQHNNII